MLSMPTPLNPKHFHSKQVVEDYQQAVAAFLAQQQAAEYEHSKNRKRNKRHDRNDY